MPARLLRAERVEHPAIELDVEGAALDERDDVSRPDESVRRMRPADERFCADERAGARVDLRLELQRERVFSDRALQVLWSETDDRHARSLAEE